MISWRIGFVAARGDACRWWQRLLRPGFAHCWAARRVWPGVWLWIEWTPQRLIVNHVRPGFVREASRAAHTLLALRAETWERDGMARPLVPMHHCATVVAHILGLPSRRWLTPWRLACALRERGALVLRGAVDGRRAD